MSDPFPPLEPSRQRARAVQRLRAAMDAAIRGGRAACLQGPHIAGTAEPLIRRLEQIRRELDQIEEIRPEAELPETHPFWINLLNEVNGQTPCGRSPPPENGAR